MLDNIVAQVVAGLGVSGEHAGQEVLLPLQAEAFSEVAFAAFYADCVHEVLPVTSGCRWVLAYNVCRREQGELPQPPDYQQEQQQPAPATHYSPIKVFTAAQVVDILVATGRVDTGLGQQAVDQMLLQPSCYPMDGTLIQAVLLAADASDCPSGIAPYLRAACLQYLETCLAKPLSPPADWTREVNFKCQANDAHCENFARFLRDPTVSSWDLRAAQGYRSALESIARNATSDVSMVTIKQGSPHTLRFTKNQASYDRRVKQRKLDERYHQQLKALN